MSQYYIKHGGAEEGLNYHEPHSCAEQNRTNLLASVPWAKMNYNNYFRRVNRQIISVSLPDNSQLALYRGLFKDRETYEQQVAASLAQGHSSKGHYYFYNWISNDEMCCQLPQGGVPLLATYIFSFEYEKAQALIETWPKNIITETLRIFFKGFVNLTKTVEANAQLKKYFFRSTIFTDDLNNTLPQPGFQPRLLLNADILAYNELIERYPTLEEQKHCIISNLNYLKQFLKYLPKSEVNQYYQLIFAFMSNTEDQIKSKNMYNMLLNCREVTLMDRLNFVQKLMPRNNRIEFFQEFAAKVTTLTNLSNLFMFRSEQPDQIQRIVLNYIDEYADLETVAAVCLEYGHPQLMKYVDMYQEMLLIGCEEKKAQDLENQQFSKLGSYCLKRTQKAEKSPEAQDLLFLSCVNFADERIEPPVVRKPPDQICFVCFRNNEKMQDIFVECGRCKHGGHLTHLLKWYEESNNACPKTDCSCYCV